jgi:hypothetical protein
VRVRLSQEKPEELDAGKYTSELRTAVVTRNQLRATTLGILMEAFVNARELGADATAASMAKRVNHILKSFEED